MVNYSNFKLLIRIQMLEISKNQIIKSYFSYHLASEIRKYESAGSRALIKILFLI